MKIELDDGKYILTDEDGPLKALRYGEEWRDLTGDKMVSSLCYEIEQLRREKNDCDEQYFFLVGHAQRIEEALEKTQTFWEQCVKKGIVVVPVEVYSDYRDGDYHEDDYVGIKYVALENGETTVLTDPWVYIDSMSTVLHETPEEALAAGYERGD
jgi:hypothetical protein